MCWIYLLLLSLLLLTDGEFSDLLGCHALVAVPAHSGTPLCVLTQQLPLQMVQDISSVVLLFLMTLSFFPFLQFDCLCEGSKNTTHIKIQFYRPTTLDNPLMFFPVHQRMSFSWDEEYPGPLSLSWTLLTHQSSVKVLDGDVGGSLVLFLHLLQLEGSVIQGYSTLIILLSYLTEHTLS